ncbi:lysostaphin resistance A-like protein [Winogradskyella sp. A3E31]|uniref:CPBP family intramembrane glutamic endopeptidase n=1 Tax=Winogradskyella sp. A3E31 TaxID=3349637 RepID=UPI00398B8243
MFLLYAVIAYFLFSEYPESLNLDLAVETVFALLVLGFSFLDYKRILKLYQLPKLNIKIIGFTFLFPIVSALTVYFSIEFINTHLFESIGENYFYSYMYLDNPLPWAILFVAITPPVFEELAFRGFLFNQLEGIISTKATIIATAFIFALIHFSFISLLWIFPFGLLLGYLRSKYQTLWYGIVIHFIHNFIVLMIDYFYYNQSIFNI